MEIIGKVYSLEKVLEEEKAKEGDSKEIDFQGNDLLAMLFNDCHNYPLLKKEEEVELITKAKSGCMESRQRFLSCNTRLAINVAKKYLRYGIPWEDLISDGYEGLIRGYEKFDLKKGFKFSTYATWWIRQSITRNIADFKRIIRIPVHMLETGNKYKSMKIQYELENGELKLNSDEAIETFAHYIVNKEEEKAITKALNTAIKKAETNKKETFNVNYENISLDEYDKRVEDHIKSIPKVLEYLWQEPISLHHPVNEGNSIIDFIESDKNPSGKIFNHRKEALEKLCRDVLSERERQVIYYRFGIEDGWQRTLEEVAHKYKLTRERIRQIESKALNKLRNPETNEEKFAANHLKEYWE